jgi:hypothetical protein
MLGGPVGRVGWEGKLGGQVGRAGWVGKSGRG